MHGEQLEFRPHRMIDRVRESISPEQSDGVGRQAKRSQRDRLRMHRFDNGGWESKGLGSDIIETPLPLGEKTMAHGVLIGFDRDGESRKEGRCIGTDGIPSHEDRLTWHTEEDHGMVELDGPVQPFQDRRQHGIEIRPTKNLADEVMQETDEQWAGCT